MKAKDEDEMEIELKLVRRLVIASILLAVAGLLAALAAGCKTTSFKETLPDGTIIEGADRTLLLNTSLSYRRTNTNGSTFAVDTQRTGPSANDIGTVIGTAIKTAK